MEESIAMQLILNSMRAGVVMNLLINDLYSAIQYWIRCRVGSTMIAGLLMAIEPSFLMRFNG